MPACASAEFKGHLRLHERGRREVLRGFCFFLYRQCHISKRISRQATPPTRMITTLKSDGHGAQEVFGATWLEGRYSRE